jgi:putative copper export protein
MRDVYVGSLFAIAVFLLSYRGHDRRDDRAGNLACVFGLGVALLPTAPAVQPTTLQRVLSGCHFAFAAAFLGTLAYFSLKLFRKTGEDGARERRKVYRDWVYTACGVVMLVCMGLIAVLSLIPGDVPVKRLRPVFWLESLAIVAFGVSWLTKGQAILRDRES